MQTIKFKITGVSPLLMHADTFANPLHPATRAHKELTKPKVKTESMHKAIAHSEYVASAYWNKHDGFHIPAQNMEGSLINAAKLNKLGVKFKQGVRVLDDLITMEGYENKNPEQLWDDPNFVDCRGVRVGTSKVMRYRPIFKKWSATTTVAFNEDVVSEQDVKRAMIDAGNLIGVCDNRPRFGRFSVEVI